MRTSEEKTGGDWQREKPVSGQSVGPSVVQSVGGMARVAHRPLLYHGVAL